MDNLPAELILLILSHLPPEDIIQVQLVSQRFHTLARSNDLWKVICFDSSAKESTRRWREMRAAQSEELAALRNAMSDAFSREQGNQNCESEPLSEGAKRNRALASWDPTWPGRDVDFWEEYVHRYADVGVSWVQSPVEGKRGGLRGEGNTLEAGGVGIVEGTGGLAKHAVAPLEDGSVCMWQLCDDDSVTAKPGRIISRSQPGLLTATSANRPTSRQSPASQPSLSNDTGAVDNVSVDGTLNHAYFATANYLSEIDLHTLQVVRREQFPFPLMCLSQASHPKPLTVGTTETIHLFDVRAHNPNFGSTSDSSVKCELIAGPQVLPSQANIHSVEHPRQQNYQQHVQLTQPGPLSILHVPTASSNDLWISGRFTSLLHYDRRFWPRIADTLFSGARLSCLSLLPHSFVPRELDPARNEELALGDFSRVKDMPGVTLMGAGEYRGKGSLDLYGLSSHEDRQGHLPGGVAEAWGGGGGGAGIPSYKNRFTASRTRLLSVAPHGGGRIVFSDGDGNLKWVEKDGSSLVRQFNINDAAGAGNGGSGRGDGDADQAPTSLWEHQHTAENTGDIVQKIVPVSCGSKDNDLLIWTGDGKIGLVGFGKKFEGFGMETGGGDGAGDDGESKEEREKEELYGRGMRRALEGLANETRFVRGLGGLFRGGSWW